MQNVSKNKIHSLINVSINCRIQRGSINEREEEVINNGRYANRHTESVIC